MKINYKKYIKIAAVLVVTPALLLFGISLYLETIDLRVFALNAIEKEGIFLFGIETLSNLDVEIDNITIEYSSDVIELRAIQQEGLTVTIQSLYTGGTGFIIDERIRLQKDQVYVYGIPYKSKKKRVNLKFNFEGKILESKWPRYLKLFPPSKQDGSKVLSLIVGEKSPNQGGLLLKSIENSKTHFKTLHFRGRAIEEIIETGIILGDKTLCIDWEPGKPVTLYVK